MKYVAPAIYLGLAAFVIFLFVRSTETYKAWENPCAYWQKQVAWRTELLATYEADARSCPAKLQELQSNRNLWIKQKTLEGMTPAEGARDFEIAVSSRRSGCEFANSMAL